MAEITRSSVLALLTEVTKGTPVAPSGATDFVALQSDFSFEPAFESLTNEELRTSVGQAKSIRGLEAPTWSFSHYLRGSGTAGTAPNYGKLLTSVFGQVNSNSTERTTTTGSTTSVIELGAGGSDFARGRAILLKDTTNGYSIRPVTSVSSNALTLGFNVANAPATGMNVGKCVTYYPISPVSNGHATVTAWLYRGNGSNIEMIAGSAVTEFNMSVEVGELINCSYTAEGTKFYFNPINILSADRYLDFTDQDGTFAAVVAAGVYRTPHHLASALQTAMDAVSARTSTVTYSDSTGKFTIAITGTTLELLWSTGSNTANTIGDKIGFTVSADDTGATTYTSDSAVSWAAPYTPSYDSADPLTAKYMEVLVGDATDTTCACATSIDFTLSVPVQNVECICAESGVDSKIITSREVTVDVVAIYTRHDADLFERMRNNTELKFLFNFGEKDTSGNWTAGKCGCLYLPTCVVENFAMTDSDGVVTMSYTLRGFVDSSSNDEVYLNFL